MIKFNIQIGTHEQKELIKTEIKNYLVPVIKSLNLEDKVAEILVPDDFKKTVIELTNNQEFDDIRYNLGHVVYAKNILANNKIYLLFNKLLFTDENDTSTRCTFYFHEIFHSAYNETKKIAFKTNQKRTEYNSLLHFLFDEYQANRFAYEFTSNIFSDPSDIFVKYVNDIKTNILSHLNDDELYYSLIMNSIDDYRYYDINIEQLVSIVFPKIKYYLTMIIYYYSLCDYIQIDRLPEIEELYFYNSGFSELINWIREKYNNLQAPFPMKLEFLDSIYDSFGFSIENIKNGLYIGVRLI